MREEKARMTRKSHVRKGHLRTTPWNMQSLSHVGSLRDSEHERLWNHRVRSRGNRLHGGSHATEVMPGVDTGGRWRTRPSGWITCAESTATPDPTWLIQRQCIDGFASTHV